MRGVRIFFFCKTQKSQDVFGHRDKPVSSPSKNFQQKKAAFQHRGLWGVFFSTATTQKLLVRKKGKAIQSPSFFHLPSIFFGGASFCSTIIIFARTPLASVNYSIYLFCGVETPQKKNLKGDFVGGSFMAHVKKA